MRFAWRLFHWPELERRYLDGGHDHLGGLWYDESVLDGLTPPAVRAAVGLDFVSASGVPAFPDDRIGLIRFAVDPRILAASRALLCSDLGGELPPACGRAWAGHGFAAGDQLIPEYRLSTVPLPHGCEAQALGPDGTRWVVGRWLRNQWVEP